MDNQLSTPNHSRSIPRCIILTWSFMWLAKSTSNFSVTWGKSQETNKRIQFTVRNKSLASTFWLLKHLRVKCAHVCIYIYIHNEWCRSEPCSHQVSRICDQCIFWGLSVASQVHVCTVNSTNWTIWLLNNWVYELILIVMNVNEGKCQWQSCEWSLYASKFSIQSAISFFHKWLRSISRFLCV